MMPYSMQPPTGYSMKAETWVSSAALLGRMNFALGLAAGRLRGISVDGSQLAAGATDPPTALAALEKTLLPETFRSRRMTRLRSDLRTRRSASGGSMMLRVRRMWRRLRG
jgi:uncharacterized protein DUF1800